MALGYCPVCLELRTIRKAPVRFPGQRETWKMAEHESPPIHETECDSWAPGADCTCPTYTQRCTGVGKYV